MRNADHGSTFRINLPLGGDRENGHPGGALDGDTPVPASALP